MAELLRRPIHPRFDLNAQERSLAWRLHLDLPLLFALLLVCAGALFVLYSASGESTDMVIRQAIRYGVGFTAMLIFAQIPPRMYGYWGVPLYVLGLLLLVLVLFFGTVVNGAVGNNTVILHLVSRSYGECKKRYHKHSHKHDGQQSDFTRLHFFTFKKEI